MRLLSFRITNFRSIVDSDWVAFSPDGITVLVGQNESGKTSVLDALHCGLVGANPIGDDFRTSAPLPRVALRVETSYSEVASSFDDIRAEDLSAIGKYLEEVSNRVEVSVGWRLDGTPAAAKYVLEVRCPDPRVKSLLDDAKLVANVSQDNAAEPSIDPEPASTSAPPTGPSPAVASKTTQTQTDLPHITPDEFADAVWQNVPGSVQFNEESGRLPNTVDIDDKGSPTGNGAKAAANFLAIAEIDLPQLLLDDKRARENKLNRANSRVSHDFNEFWSQTIGKEGRLALKCDLDHYPLSAAEKSGKPHLVFWICDGNTQLYPKQRSQGVRWFISFYLQLKASEKAGLRRVFLLDEPGANLHSKAQGDVLKLINKLGKEISSVVYTTHSPQMIEHQKLFRVHAVQRDGELDDSPTTVIDAHRLGAASTDTLSPVLSAMGADLSQHQVVKKKNNVLLEEMSGYYYLCAFWKLLNVRTDAHFIAATGVNKIETLANMFKGWGLEFIVAIDDDKQGREVYKNLKREHFADDEVAARKRLLKLPHGTGIEDTFSVEDFKRFILEDGTAALESSVTDFLKTAGRSKPVLAFQFALKVDQGSVKFKDLSVETQGQIKQTVALIDSMLTGDA